LTKKRCDRWHFYRPTQRADSLSQIDVAALTGAGIRAVLLDMDNTLSTWRGRELAPDALAFVEKLRQAGIDMAVFSNNRIKNVSGLADQLGIPHAIANAGKPAKRAFLRAAARMGCAPNACAVVGDQLMTDIIGANRAGFGATVLMRPLSPTEWVFTKYNRMREALILRRSGQKHNVAHAKRSPYS